MPRWRPGAHARLEQAALELFAERGYDATTVADIAERAGLTTRTFFNHFSDKAEVVFQGYRALSEALEATARTASLDLDPFDVLAASLRAGAAQHESDPDAIRARHAIIVGHPALREREQLKRAGVADTLTGALHGRGVDRRTARLLSAVGVAVFAAAYEEWINNPSLDGQFGDLVEDSLTLLHITP